jgi:hypothetical protein
VDVATAVESLETDPTVYWVRMKGHNVNNVDVMIGDELCKKGFTLPAGDVTEFACDSPVSLLRGGQVTIRGPWKADKELRAQVFYLCLVELLVGDRDVELIRYDRQEAQYLDERCTSSRPISASLVYPIQTLAYGNQSLQIPNDPRGYSRFRRGCTGSMPWEQTVSCVPDETRDDHCDETNQYFKVEEMSAHAQSRRRRDALEHNHDV